VLAVQLGRVHCVVVSETDCRCFDTEFFSGA
jgi:hypothetical protein